MQSREQASAGPTRDAWFATKAALLHLDTDFELHQLSHGPGDAAVSPPTTRRLVTVQTDSVVECRRRGW
jgi:hypothetical protein